MSILKIVLEKDQALDFTPERFNNSWQNEIPIVQPTDYDIATLKGFTRDYADLMSSLSPSPVLMKSVTYSKALLESLPVESKGIRIYLGLREITINGNAVKEIFPILVPVGSTYEDLIDDNPNNLSFMIDGESKCPPPANACNNDKLKLLPE